MQRAFQPFGVSADQASNGEEENEVQQQLTIEEMIKELEGQQLFWIQGSHFITYLHV